MKRQAVCLALLLGLPVGPSGQGVATRLQAQTPSRSSGGATQWMSPSVVATWLTERDHDGRERLELLVLWRGQPGWFLRPGNEIRSEYLSAAVGRHIIAYGDIRLTLDYDRSTRGATVNGTSLTLDEHNVILVDDVDSLSGPRIVRTFRVPPEMSGSAGQLGPVLTSSPDVMVFLRCEAPVPADKPRQILERLCLQTLAIEK